jgi:hypothetical protein
LIDLLSTLLVDDVWIVRYKDPKISTQQVYYVSQPYNGEANLISHFVGFDGKERTKFIVKEFVDSYGISPQTKIARKFKPLLMSKTIVDEWDDVSIKLLSDVRDNPEMDAVLKVALLRKIYEHAAAGSTPIAKAFEQVQVQLASLNSDVPWMDPGNSDAIRIREKAELVIADLPNFAEIGRKAKAIEASIEAFPTQIPQPVGWLRQEAAEWHLNTDTSFPHDAQLWVAVATDRKESIPKRAVWKTAGSIRNGAVRISSPDATVFEEGRPVFIIP